MRVVVQNACARSPPLRRWLTAPQASLKESGKRYSPLIYVNLSKRAVVQNACARSIVPATSAIADSTLSIIKSAKKICVFTFNIHGCIYACGGAEHVRAFWPLW